MGIVTLTTDFGLKDYSVAAVKGAILSQLPNTSIIDISHEISPFNIIETAYIFKNAISNFPKGTVHIVGVEAELRPDNFHIACLFKDQYIICADNGLLSLVLGETHPEQLVKINIHDNLTTSFPVLEVFVQVACHIIRGGKLDVIGVRLNSFKKLKSLQAKALANGKGINGHIIYIDNYGNAVTNITKKMFNELGMGKSFELKAGGYSFTKIHNKYSDVIKFNGSQASQTADGEKIALFNSAGHLEIAIYKSNLKSVGGASTLLGLHFREVVLIEFN